MKMQVEIFYFSHISNFFFILVEIKVNTIFLADLKDIVYSKFKDF